MTGHLEHPQNIGIFFFDNPTDEEITNYVTDPTLADTWDAFDAADLVECVHEYETELGTYQTARAIYVAFLNDAQEQIVAAWHDP